MHPLDTYRILFIVNELAQSGAWKDECFHTNDIFIKSEANYGGDTHGNVK
jgi:hypothetical protein